MRPLTQAGPAEERWQLFFDDRPGGTGLSKIEERGSISSTPSRAAWGQRVMRLYDPDGFIVEIGETRRRSCAASTLKPERAAGQRQNIQPLGLVERVIREASSEKLTIKS